MNAIYIRPRNCLICLDSGFDGDPPCDYCEKINTYNVKILDFRRSLIGSKAIILFDDGKIKEVSLSTLKIIDS